jgi:putative glutamine amidotransferase
VTDADRPLVAVVAYHLNARRVTRWPAGGYGVPTPYVDALRRAGGRAAILPPGEDGDAEELLARFDGLLLVGGGDAAPERYGQEPGAHVYGVEPDRDETEIGLVRAAARARIPTLCICRGMQIMNVAFGGTLLQHLPDVPGLLPHGVPLDGTHPMHDVVPETGSWLSTTTNASVLACSSHHHQGVDRLGEGLVVVGRSPDGLVEAVSSDASEGEDAAWLLGVQWHPEETAANDPAQQALFDGFVALARRRGRSARGWPERAARD